MKKSIIFPVLLIFCIASGCAVAPKKSSSDMSEKRDAKRAAIMRAKVAGKVEQVVADVDSSEKKVENLRGRRANVQQPASPANERGEGQIAVRKPSAADDINPAQTSVDPTFGRTKENPVTLGSSNAGQGAASSYVYLRQLRDRNRQPFKFVRVGNVGQGGDGHFIDLYKLTDSEGAESKIFIDMYHPENSPLDCKAPAGMYIAQ